MASVTVYFSGHEQGSYQLDKPMMVVGREASCQIYLDNRSISRQHCAFIFKDNDFLIQDLNSANGTYVNGQRITETRLKHGDEIIIGNYELRYFSASSVAVPPIAAGATAVTPAAVDVSANTLDENAFRNAAPVASPAMAATVPKSEPPRADLKDNDQWFYAENNRQAGPVDTNTLKRLVKANVVARNTLVWKDGMANWTPAGDVPGLVSEPPPLPPAGRQPPALPPAIPQAPMPAPVPARAPAPAPQPAPAPARPVGLPAGLSLPDTPGANSDPFDRALLKGLGHYLIVWGITLLITACWQAWAVVKTSAQATGALLYGGYIAIVAVSMVCAILSLFAGASFIGLGSARYADIPALMQALWSIKRVHLMQCILALLLLALLIIPHFMH